jgi:Leucine-rich repeat (LRR) protein
MMPRFDIEHYLYSLPENTTHIDIRAKGIYELPDIIQFTNLQYLNCDDNYLTSLPELPASLIYLSCDRNNLQTLPVLPANLQYLYCSSNPLRSLPTLPANLQQLYCVSNKLTSLPTLPANLLHLYCSDNQLTALPELPEHLQNLHFAHNELTSMPNLPENIDSFGYQFNPIWQTISRIIYRHHIYSNIDSLTAIKKINTILNSFRHLYYSLQLKHKFTQLLWERLRRPKIENKFNPKYLIANLKEDADLDGFLEEWIGVDDFGKTVN